MGGVHLTHRKPYTRVEVDSSRRRRCTVCRRWRHRKRFYVSRMAGKLRFLSRCVDCHKAAAADYYARNRAEILARRKGLNP